MIDMIYETESAKETFDLAESIAAKITPGIVVCLNGDLGVGKTVFAQGFAKGLGIKEHVNSPTFTIVQVYDDGTMPLYHFDVYRIGDCEEMYEIGYEDYFFGDGVCLVEWSDNIAELIPKNSKRVTIEKDYTKGNDYRKIIIE